MKKTLFAIAMVTASLMIFSCSKQDVSQPASVQQDVTTQNSDLYDATARTTPAAGNYKVRLYIDDNDTSTYIFKGYVFNFKSNGVLTATVNNTTYTGEWRMSNGGAEMKLEIEGTPALEKIDKSWDVVNITNTVITLTDNDPGEITKLVFKKL